MAERPPKKASATTSTAPRLVRATPEDIDSLTTLVAAYHAFERIDMSSDRRQLALSQLLANPTLGEVWFIHNHGALVGYIAICFGYSIEFAGRDAFVDEFFLNETARGRGTGGLVIDRISALLADAGIAALHLEVDNDNTGAQRFYARHRFAARKKYHLMSVNLQELNADPV